MRPMLRVLAVAGAVLILGVACADPNSDQATATGPTVEPGFPLEPSEPFGRTTVTLRSPDAQTRVDLPVYDAFHPDARSRGLMFRESLPPGTGMVFRRPDDRDRGFWMKDTLIPLSIAYFAADGEVVDVLDMEPCRSDPCPGYPPAAPYRNALEVNQGYFAEVGLEPGWYIEVPEGLPAPS